MKRDLAIIGAIVVAAVLIGAATMRDVGRSFDPGVVNGRFPALQLHRLDGSSLAFDGRGGTITVVNFFATWCTPCQRETPALAALSRTAWGSHLRFVQIDVAESADKVNAFVRRYGSVRGDMLIGDEHDARDAGVVPLPQTLIVSSDGKIVSRHVGYIEPADVRRLVTCGRAVASAGAREPSCS